MEIKSYKLTIQGSLPGLNDYIHALSLNRYAGGRLKKDTDEIISSEIMVQKLPYIQEPVYLIFRWYEKNKKRDKDNIASAKKFICDALKKSHVIGNDTWNLISGFSDEFYLDKDNPRVEVIISID